MRHAKASRDVRGSNLVIKRVKRDRGSPAGGPHDHVFLAMPIVDTGLGTYTESLFGPSNETRP